MRTIIICLLAVILSGCSTIDVSQYRNNAPRLDLFEFFQGSTKGWGIVQDWRGQLTRQFTVDIIGTLDGDSTLTLEEKFYWDDGKESERVWVITRSDDHSYSGRADDVVGSASGVLYGNVLNWQYQLNLEVDDDTWKIGFDDWMFLVSRELLLNRATMKKFGLKVGEVTIAFQKK